MAVLGALSLIMVIAGCVPFVEPTPSAGRATVAMNPMGSEGFFSLPWPNDIRKKADGTLDLAGLPDNSNVVLRVVIDRVGASVSDFATNGAIYLRTTAPIDPSTLPNPTSSVVPASPILVVNVDDHGPASLSWRGSIAVGTRPGRTSSRCCRIQVMPCGRTPGMSWRSPMHCTQPTVNRSNRRG